VETIVTFFSAAGQGRVVVCRNSQEEGCQQEDFEKLRVKKSSYESETFDGTALSLITLNRKTITLNRMTQPGANIIKLFLSVTYELS
jgi:hypothetical protein